MIDSHDLETEKIVLIALYSSTNGAEWGNKTGWLTDAAVTRLLANGLVSRGRSSVGFNLIFFLFF